MRNEHDFNMYTTLVSQADTTTVCFLSLLLRSVGKEDTGNKLSLAKPIYFQSAVHSPSQPTIAKVIRLTITKKSELLNPNSF